MIKEKELKIVHCNIDSCADRGNADRLLKEVLKQNVVIDRITIEYVVIQEEDGGVSCFPFWRFLYVL